MKVIKVDEIPEIEISSLPTGFSVPKRSGVCLWIEDTERRPNVSYTAMWLEIELCCGSNPEFKARLDRPLDLHHFRGGIAIDFDSLLGVQDFCMKDSEHVVSSLLALIVAQEAQLTVELLPETRDLFFTLKFKIGNAKPYTGSARVAEENYKSFFDVGPTDTT